MLESRGDAELNHANIFGYFYDIDTGGLTEVVKDKAEAILMP